MIRDNVEFGEWEWERLANEWDDGELKEWGVVMSWDAGTYDGDPTEKGMAINTVIKLEYNEEEYQAVKHGLAQIAPTPEAAVWKLLGKD